MTTAFEKYRSNQTYKSLVRTEYFIDRTLNDSSMFDLLSRVFTESEEYQEVVGKLKFVLNEKGLKSFRERFKKYKWSYNNSDYPFSIKAENGKKIKKLMKRLEFKTHDELMMYLLDPTDWLLKEIANINDSVSFEVFYKKLPHHYQLAIRNEILKNHDEAFIKGIRAVPSDLRKKTALNSITIEEMDNSRRELKEKYAR